MTVARGGILRRLRAVGAAVVVAAVASLAVACSAGEETGETSVLVIGDAASAPSQGPAWPTLVQTERDVRTEVDAVEGSGYLTAAPESVRDRLEVANPADVIVIALGATDVLAGAPDDAIRAAVSDAIGAATATGARVIVTAPLVPGVFPAASVIESVAREQGAQYVPVTLPPDAAADAGSLSPAGQQVVADAVGTALGD